MVLGFKNRFPEKIISGIKIHTFRNGQRWRAGMSVQMATGTRTKNYHQFNKGIPELGTCISTQRLDMYWFTKDLEGGKTLMVYIDQRRIKGAELEALYLNDGFEGQEDFEAYWKDQEPIINGQVVHWTIFKY